ncbi:hypothetical protein ACFQMM_02585 [Saliphagus sp. GCM10025308]
MNYSSDSVVYTLTEKISYEGTTIHGVYSDKKDALADDHDAAHEQQTGYDEDYSISHWSDGSKSLQIDDTTWIVTPEEAK